MENKNQTIETYNRSAAGLGKKFDRIGARVSDIEETFALVKKENPNVLEHGCGNGRDAQEIVKRTNEYYGIDISEELLKLAKEKVPGARFELGDISDFDFPEGIDIVFAFASLIHVTKEEFRTVLKKLYYTLNKGGVIRMSLKYSPNYGEVTQGDEFGIRNYYFYSPVDIKEMAEKFEILKSKITEGRNEKWLEVILRK